MCDVLRRGWFPRGLDAERPGVRSHAERGNEEFVSDFEFCIYLFLLVFFFFLAAELLATALVFLLSPLFFLPKMASYPSANFLVSARPTRTILT